jgi:hypothetical protein
LGTNSRPHFELTGTQILYESGVPGIGINLHAYTIYLVVGDVSKTKDMYPFAQSHASTRQYIQLNNAPNRISFAHSDDSDDPNRLSRIHWKAPTLTDGNAHLIVAVRNAEHRFKLRYDGIDLVTGSKSPGPSATTITSVGARLRTGGSISNQYEGMIGLVAIYDNDNVATVFDGSTIETKINTFYGVF